MQARSWFIRLGGGFGGRVSMSSLVFFARDSFVPDLDTGRGGYGGFCNFGGRTECTGASMTTSSLNAPDRFCASMSRRA